MRYHNRFIGWASRSIAREDGERNALSAIIDNLPEDLKQLKQKLSTQARIYDRAYTRAFGLWIGLLFFGTVIAVVMYSHVATPLTLVVAYLIALGPSSLAFLYAIVLVHLRNNRFREWKRALLHAKHGRIPLYGDTLEVV